MSTATITSPRTADRDYVLGTHYEELKRLGLQHQVWRPTVLECWKNAGLQPGARVVDVGAGPGYATLDLAEVVGPEGEVYCVERSRRFVEAATEACQERHFHHVHFHELDLMEDALPATGLDAAWCRWVACFVPAPELLVERIAQSLRPGGVAIFHEFLDYSTWRLAAACPVLEDFVKQVMQSWQETGGDPNVARRLPSLLNRAGFAFVRRCRASSACVRMS
ncbi:MAG: class I SAM-dependent methyltransferase [Chthoniobacteraceae bacterium]